MRDARPWRLVLLVVVEVVVVVGLLAFAAGVAIPALAPGLATPTPALGGFGDCPRGLPGCS